MKTIQQKGEWRFPVENSFVRDSSLSVEARLLYIILKGFVGPDGASPFPSLGTLSRHMDRHRESVQKYLNELWCNGYIDRVHPKIAGRFASTRYLIFDRSGKKPLRKLPTTEISSTKKYQFKEVPREKEDLPQGSKEDASATAEVSADATAEEFSATWEPDRRSKAEKLKSIPPPKRPDYPSQREFVAFIEKESLDGILAHRDLDQLYDKLTDEKWRRYQGGHWIRIRDWRAYVRGLDDAIVIATNRERRF